MMSSADRKMLEEMSHHELEDRLNHMKEGGKYTDEEIEEFKKNYIIKRSLDQVRERSKQMDEIRHSPQRYKGVRGKAIKAAGLIKKGNRMHTKSMTHSQMGSTIKMVHTTKDPLFQRELDSTWKKMQEGSPDAK